MKLAEIKMNENEQYSRRNNLRYIGVKLLQNETVPAAVIRCTNAYLNLGTDEQGNRRSLSPSDIEVAHFIKRREPPGAAHSPRSGSEAPHSIIVRFADRKVRDSVIRARRQLKNKPITITEDLTHKNQRLMHTVKAVSSVDNAWSWNGKIYYVLTGQRSPKQIQLHDQLPE